MKLFVARHPETHANREGLILGAGDSPPIDEGLEVFKRTIEVIGRERIDIIISSPLSRALIGARLAADMFNCDMTVEPEMRELSCGEWEGRRREELALQDRPIRRTWTDRPPGGESYLDAEKRLKPVVEHLKASVEHNTALIVGHSVVNRVLVKLWLNMGQKEALEFNHGFDKVYILSRRRTLEKVAIDRAT